MNLGISMSKDVDLKLYNDQNKIEEYCNDAMKWAIEKEIVIPVKDKNKKINIKPNDKVTRGEAAQMFATLMKLD